MNDHTIRISFLKQKIMQEIVNKITHTAIKGPLVGIPSHEYVIHEYNSIFPLNISQPLYEGIQWIKVSRKQNKISITESKKQSSIRCSICLETLFHSDEEITSVAIWYHPYPFTCGHMYHFLCLLQLMDTWICEIKNNAWPARKCPLCRHGMEGNCWYRNCNNVPLVTPFVNYISTQTQPEPCTQLFIRCRTYLARSPSQSNVRLLRTIMNQENATIHFTSHMSGMLINEESEIEFQLVRTNSDKTDVLAKTFPVRFNLYTLLSQTRDDNIFLTPQLTPQKGSIYDSIYTEWVIIRRHSVKPVRTKNNETQNQYFFVAYHKSGWILSGYDIHLDKQTHQTSKHLLFHSSEQPQVCDSVFCGIYLETISILSPSHWIHKNTDVSLQHNYNLYQSYSYSCSVVRKPCVCLDDSFAFQLDLQNRRCLNSFSSMMTPVRFVPLPTVGKVDKSLDDWSVNLDYRSESSDKRCFQNTRRCLPPSNLPLSMDHSYIWFESYFKMVTHLDVMDSQQSSVVGYFFQLKVSRYHSSQLAFMMGRLLYFPSSCWSNPKRHFELFPYRLSPVRCVNPNVAWGHAFLEVRGTCVTVQFGILASCFNMHYPLSLQFMKPFWERQCDILSFPEQPALSLQYFWTYKTPFTRIDSVQKSFYVTNNNKKYSRLQSVSLVRAEDKSKNEDEKESEQYRCHWMSFFEPLFVYLVQFRHHHVEEIQFKNEVHYMMNQKCYLHTTFLSAWVLCSYFCGHVGYNQNQNWKSEKMDEKDPIHVKVELQDQRMYNWNKWVEQKHKMSCTIVYQLCILSQQMGLFRLLPPPTQNMKRLIFSEDLIVGCCYISTKINGDFQSTLSWVLSQIDTTTFDSNAMVEGLRLLSRAVLRNNISIVSFLLNNSVDVKLLDENGSSILYHCVAPGKEKMLEKVLIKWNDYPIAQEEIFTKKYFIDPYLKNTEEKKAEEVDNVNDRRKETVMERIIRQKSFAAYDILLPFIAPSESDLEYRVRMINT